MYDIIYDIYDMIYDAWVYYDFMMFNYIIFLELIEQLVYWFIFIESFAQ